MCPQGCGGSSPPFGTSYLRRTNSSESTSCARVCAREEVVSAEEPVRPARRGDGGTQMLRRKMCVLHRHRDAAVTQQLLQLRQAYAALHHPGRERVAQGVERDVIQLGGQHSVLVRGANLVSPEHPTVLLRPQAHQRGV